MTQSSVPLSPGTFSMYSRNSIKNKNLKAVLGGESMNCIRWVLNISPYCYLSTTITSLLSFQPQRTRPGGITFSLPTRRKAALGVIFIWQMAGGENMQQLLHRLLDCSPIRCCFSLWLCVCVCVILQGEGQSWRLLQGREHLFPHFVAALGLQGWIGLDPK